MIVFQVQVVDFVRGGINAEGQAPVPCDTQAPGALAVAGEDMRFPRGECPQFFRVRHRIKEPQHLAEFVYGIGWHAFDAVVFIEPIQPLMKEVSNTHRASVACCATLVKKTKWADPMGQRVQNSRIHLPVSC